MNDPNVLDREAAKLYASWFKALADPMRVQIVSLLARRGAPMTVGEIVEAVPVGQSTVSHHLKALAEVRFVLAERKGTTSLFRINTACVQRFPSAADVLMGREAPAPPGAADGAGPILTRPGATPTATPAVTLVPMRAEHAEEVLAIYQAGLDTGDASFETAAPTWEAWDAAHLPDHRRVALDEDGRVLGWVALSPVSDRCVYAGVAEVSVYVHPEARGRGVGLALLRAVIASSEAAGIWTLQTGIFPENTASLTLHRRVGFRLLGIRERVGRHHDRWRDVAFLERRSPLVR